MVAGALNPKVNDNPVEQFPDSQIVRASKVDYVDVQIDNGASLSAVVYVRGAVCGILIPAAWTAADMTFQGSVSGTNYNDIYDGATERKIASASIPTASSRWLALSLADWLGFNYLKLRSGTAAAAVNQGAARVLRLALAG